MLGDARDPEDRNRGQPSPEPGTLECVAFGPRQYDPPDPDDLLDLLRLATETDVALGVAGVAEACAERLGKMFGDAAVGVSIVEPRQPERMVRCSGLEPGAGAPNVSSGRLFPACAFERVVHLPGVPESTLHVASNDADLAEAGYKHARTLEAAGNVVATLVERALNHEQVRASVVKLRQLEARLVEGQRMASLGQIVAGVAHEINNPLTSILAYVALLRRRNVAAPKEEAERLDRIEEAAQRILKFTHDVVAYVRPSCGVPAPVGINDVIGKALIFCEHEFSQHGVEVHFDAEQPLPPVLGVASQLIQVFVNLFTNAAHAMCERGGHLRISTNLERGALRVEVSDTGVGIDPEHHRHVFERFFTTRTDGGGLGLSIVREIVTAHGGVITAGHAEDGGAVLTVTLPRHAPAPVAH